MQAIFDVAKSKGLMPVNPVRAYREGRKKRGAARAGGVDQIDMERFTDSEAAVLLEEARKQHLADRRGPLALRPLRLPRFPDYEPSPSGHTAICPFLSGK